ncbi:MAG: lysophospholipid acyltransferase family protein [Hyphomicrobium sp.]
MIGHFRAVAVVILFFSLTIPLIPIQFIFIKIFPKSAGLLPQWYHRKLCKLLGLRIRIEGHLKTTSSLLIVSNHTSWLDIPLLSAIAPVSFVAKREVEYWPFISTLAKLQRTIFVNRLLRSASRKNAGEILERLSRGDAVVLFGEGTSTDGNRVLPFKSSLFSAVIPSKTMNCFPVEVVVQTISLVYTRLHGVPLGWSDRSIVGWYGEMEFMSHAWELLKRGPLDVTITIGPPLSLDAFISRKELADYTGRVIQKEVVRLLRGYSTDKIFQTPKSTHSMRHSFLSKSSTRNWQ